MPTVTFEMTSNLQPSEFCAPLTSFTGDAGRLHVCPTAQGVHITVQRYDGPPHGMMIEREQALELLRLLQQAFPKQG
ncbi:hypothetical protein [Deinococcus apachensis]|uniref:hypothetical protein n=1 Tax=Deinococcus apachensis TaxID=309886 RepID=UPI00035F15B9|nr:hypothetical protein [Deinococcus apachensis]